MFGIVTSTTLPCGRGGGEEVRRATCASPDFSSSLGVMARRIELIHLGIAQRRSCLFAALALLIITETSIYLYDIYPISQQPTTQPSSSAALGSSALVYSARSTLCDVGLLAAGPALGSWVPNSCFLCLEVAGLGVPELCGCFARLKPCHLLL